MIHTKARRHEGGWSIHDTPQPIAKRFLTEVHQQAERKVEQFQISEDLLCMHGDQVINGFDFDHELLFDQKVSAKSIRDADAIKFDCDRPLLLNEKSTRPKLLAQHNFIH